MINLIKLVRIYRLSIGLSERLRLAEEIFHVIEPELHFFIATKLSPPASQDVVQEALKAIAISLGKFQGNTVEAFWAWCYRIARNKLNDHFRQDACSRLQPMSEEELWALVESSARHIPLSPADRLDLEQAMKLLTRSKPECHDYLWKHFVFGLSHAEIAEEQNITYDSARMRVGRCLDEAQSLMA